MIGGFGGGYFFGPFSKTNGIGLTGVNPGAVVGAYGAWVHSNPLTLTAGGRWLQVNIWPNAYGAIYTVQLGLGPAGSEILFQPSDGSGFYMDWFSAIKWAVPFVISFPVTVPPQTDISIRCASAPGGTNQISATLYIWN